MSKNHEVDEVFKLIIDAFGEPTSGKRISDDVVARFSPNLPPRQISYWYAYGACKFGQGMLWMVDPENYQEILNSWLKGSQFENRNDLTVIARNAFGALDVWANKKGIIFAIDPLINTIFYFPEIDQKSLTPDEENDHLSAFWGFLDPEDVDELDENDEPLFLRALEKLGKLSSNDMYGYALSRQMGGAANLENMDKYDIGVYHDISLQLGGRRIVTLTEGD